MSFMSITLYRNVLALSLSSIIRDPRAPRHSRPGQLTDGLLIYLRRRRSSGEFARVDGLLLKNHGTRSMTSYDA